ncbi:hypothetical protein GUJ93_ZPchr0444g28992 [Zizania palustris]|uniref:Uncharacterized protein n=1 Tax=Zizania palustris TaxID=103762 RepID=A0A8J5X5X7_ZIZPA|nr:hypothetical protein GUJ93_ZPchr0444g28992 [Zizania palustris]
MTISKSVFDIVYRSHASAFMIWDTVQNLFHDNELQRVVYIEAEFRTLHQGDMSITDYTAKLKTLADNLRDTEKPVSEPSQVLNLLRGLSPKYMHIKPVITAKFMPHTFMIAWSYLLVEELYADHNVKMESNTTFYNNSGSSKSTTPPAGSTDSNASNSNNSRSKKRDCGGCGPNPNNTPCPQLLGMPWTAGYNPWIDLVQA